MRIGVFLLLLLASCQRSYTPKPHGYLRIDLPAPTYSNYANKDFSFLVPNGVKIHHTDTTDGSWLTLAYPSMGITVYGTFIHTSNRNNLDLALADANRLAVQGAKNKHSIRAKSYSHPEEQVYGLFYSLDETEASPLQLVLTDSTSRLFRAALYLNTPQRGDSLSPILQYIETDLFQLVQSFRWNKQREK